MKPLLLREKPKSKWNLKVTCGLQLDGKTSPGGCGSIYSIEEQDTFQIPFDFGARKGVLPCWQCSSCRHINSLPPSVVEYITLQDRKDYLQRMKLETVLQLLKLHPKPERVDELETLSNDFLLGENFLAKVSLDTSWQ